MEINKISEDQKCPTCGNMVSGAVEITVGSDFSGRPRPGDFSCCFECGQVLRFDENMVQVASDLTEAFMQMPFGMYEGFRKCVQQIERIYKRKQEG